jgi:hypothetical protein
MTQPNQFPNHRSQIAFALSYCKGGRIDPWANWMFDIIRMNEPTAPQNLNEFFHLLQNYFGDPQKSMTARIRMDKLKQTDTVDDYIIKFQSLMVDTQYEQAELSHRFLQGLKAMAREKVVMTQPMPTTLGGMMDVAMRWQRARDMMLAMEQGQSYIVKPMQQPSSNNPRSMHAYQPRAFQSNNWPKGGHAGNQGGERYVTNRSAQGNTGGQTFQGTGEPMQIDKWRQQCHFCGKFGHIQSQCRRKLGLCLRCGKAGHSARDCKAERVRGVTREESEEEGSSKPGFVEDL